MATASPIQTATQREELIEISQCTDLIHTIIEEAAKQHVYINWRHQSGMVLDRSQDRAPVISRKVFTLICALGYMSAQYVLFVDRAVAYMRHHQHTLRGIGLNTAHHQETGMALHEFSEETLDFIYNDMTRRQLELNAMVQAEKEKRYGNDDKDKEGKTRYPCV
jgi:hypothetical protein